MDTLLVDLDLAREAAIHTEIERLQGVWNYVSGVREAQMILVGDRFTVQFSNGDLYLGVYTLDPTTVPKMMDMTIREGPDKHRGKTSLVIYELDGDQLIWCPAEPGTGNRRGFFPSDDDTLRLCLVFRRDKTRPASS